MTTAATLRGPSAQPSGLQFRHYQRAELSGLLLAPLLPYAHIETPFSDDPVTEVRRALVNQCLLQQTAKYIQVRLGIHPNDKELRRRLDRINVAIQSERGIRFQAAGEV